MLSKITWEQYLIAVAIILVCYYLLLAICCYRIEIFHIIKGHAKTAGPKPIAAPGEATGADLDIIVRELRDILKEAGKEAGKSALLLQLRMRLANSARLWLPAFRMAINKEIIKYTESYCGVVISEQELEEAWKGTAPLI